MHDQMTSGEQENILTALSEIEEQGLSMLATIESNGYDSH